MNPLRLLWSFRGRIGRLAYFGGLWLNTVWAAAAIAAIVYFDLGRKPGEPPNLVFGHIFLTGYVLFLWALFALVAKRLHDLGKSGWLSLLLIVPIFGGMVLIFLHFPRGDDYDNAYGPVQRKGAPLPQPSRT
jgi:uncharacterized membrane protein YhaH (DUF805 family)